MNKFLTAAVLAFVLLVSVPAFALSVSGYQVSQVEINPVGSNASISMGQSAPLAQFQIQNRGDKHLAFEFIELKNYGNADLTESFKNWQIQIGGQRVEAWVWTERKKISIMFFEPVVIGRGDSVKVVLNAQLVWARTNRDVQLGLYRSDDIDLREIHTNAYAEIITDTPIRFTEHDLRPGGLYFRRQPRRTYRR